MTFEESTEKVTANVASLGFDLEQLQKDGLLIIQAFRVEPTEVVGTGEFDFEPLFLVLDDAIKRVGARRVVLDSVEALFAAFKSQAVVRAELGRLFRWLEDREVTAIVTGERGENDALTRHGIEEYVSDCVIVLDHRVLDGVATRQLQVVKYRGTAHETNEYPFVIGARHHGAAGHLRGAEPRGEQRADSTGVPRLDDMLSGGLLAGHGRPDQRGGGNRQDHAVGHLVDAACARGERALLILHEESAGEVIRNMHSIGLDLGRWVRQACCGSGRPGRARRAWKPTWRSCPGWSRSTRRTWWWSMGRSAIWTGSPRRDSLVPGCKFHLFKSKGITTVLTILAVQGDETAVGVPRWSTPGCCCATSSPTASEIAGSSCSSRVASPIPTRSASSS